MSAKDHTKWNFDTVQDLIEGPLLNPRRMEEVTRASKFLRRLMSFFHPFSHRFSDIKRTKVSPVSLQRSQREQNAVGEYPLGETRLLSFDDSSCELGGDSIPVH